MYQSSIPQVIKEEIDAVEKELRVELEDSKPDEMEALLSGFESLVLRAIDWPCITAQWPCFGL